MVPGFFEQFPGDHRQILMFFHVVILEWIQGILEEVQMIFEVVSVVLEEIVKLLLSQNVIFNRKEGRSSNVWKTLKRSVLEHVCEKVLLVRMS